MWFKYLQEFKLAFFFCFRIKQPHKIIYFWAVGKLPSWDLLVQLWWSANQLRQPFLWARIASPWSHCGSKSIPWSKNQFHCSCVHDKMNDQQPNGLSKLKPSTSLNWKQKGICNKSAPSWKILQKEHSMPQTNWTSSTESGNLLMLKWGWPYWGIDSWRYCCFRSKVHLILAT